MNLDPREDSFLCNAGYSIVRQKNAVGKGDRSRFIGDRPQGEQWYQNDVKLLHDE